jgi:hypothetical protein
VSHGMKWSATEGGARASHARAVLRAYRSGGGGVVQIPVTVSPEPSLKSRARGRDSNFFRTTGWKFDALPRALQGVVSVIAPSRTAPHPSGLRPDSAATTLR